MHMIGRVAFVWLALSATSWTALAADATIGDVSLKLPPPSGYCEMSAKDPSDARMLTAVKGMLGSGGNQLLGISVVCKQLTDWRKGSRKLLDDMSQYQTPDGAATANYAPDMVAKVCAATREQGEKTVSGLLPDANKRLEEVMKDVKMNEMRFLGVLDEDATACYTLVLQKITTEIGTEKTQLVLNAITIVKAKPVFYYLFSVYQNEKTATAMLAKHKINVGALLAANKN
jgi:hypothetical protein